MEIESEPTTLADKVSVKLEDGHLLESQENTNDCSE